jgi:hypothetical protein
LEGELKTEYSEDLTISQQGKAVNMTQKEVDDDERRLAPKKKLL